MSEPMLAEGPEAVRSHLIRMLGDLNGTGDVLCTEQRRRVERARRVMTAGMPIGVDRETVLADQLRAVLAVIDEIAPKGECR